MIKSHNSSMCSICQKRNDTEIRKQKIMLYWVFEMTTAFGNACIHPSPQASCKPVKGGTGESESVSLSPFWQVTKKMPESVWQWTLVALAISTSLHFNCLKATDGRAERDATWHDLRGLLHSHSDIVSLLMQSNFIELQASLNIFVWAAWLYDCCVQALLLVSKRCWQFKMFYTSSLSSLIWIASAM
jgi:hypothetical protein